MNEEAVGQGVKRAIDEGIVKREDLFVSTKLWPTLYENDVAVENKSLHDLKEKMHESE